MDWPTGSMALYRHCTRRLEFEMLPSFSIEEQQGSRNTSVLICLGLHARPSPERSRFVVVEVDVDHPLQLPERLPHLAGAGARTGGVHPPGKEPLELISIHPDEKGKPRCIHSVVQFGEPGIAEVILLCCMVTIDGLEIAGDVFSPVAPPVDALRLFGGGGEFFVVILQVATEAVGVGSTRSGYGRAAHGPWSPGHFLPRSGRSRRRLPSPCCQAEAGRW